MNKCGKLLVTMNLVVHDVERAEDDAIRDNVYSALSVFGEVDIDNFEKEPYDEVYENDAKMLLTLATDSCEVSDEFNATHLITDITEQDIKDRLSNKGFNCSVNITNKEWEAA